MIRPPKVVYMKQDPLSMLIAVIGSEKLIQDIVRDVPPILHFWRKPSLLRSSELLATTKI